VLFIVTRQRGVCCLVTALASSSRASSVFRQVAFPHALPSPDESNEPNRQRSESVIKQLLRLINESLIHTYGRITSKPRAMRIGLVFRAVCQRSMSASTTIDAQLALEHGKDGEMST
jgi:hypothetical protein